MVDGTFSVYADGNEEPFFEHQLEVKIDTVKYIEVKPLSENKELVALVDCSSIIAPVCGSFRIDKLYGSV